MLLLQDPEEFIPDRFMEGTPEAAAVTPDAWVPFGGGVRACVGEKFAMAVSPHALCAAFMHESRCAGSKGCAHPTQPIPKQIYGSIGAFLVLLSPSQLCCPSSKSKDSKWVPPCRRPRSHWYACSSATCLSWHQGRSHWSSATQSPSPLRTASLSGPSRTRKHRGRQHMLTERMQHTHGVASFLCRCCWYSCQESRGVLSGIWIAP